MTTLLSALTIIFIFGLLPSGIGWWVSTSFIRRAITNDYCYYYRNGERRTGRIIKKGFYKTYVIDAFDLKVRRVSNARIYPTEYQRSC